MLRRNMLSDLSPDNFKGDVEPGKSRSDKSQKSLFSCHSANGQMHSLTPDSGRKTQREIAAATSKTEFDSNYF